jgi:type I restriction enzyme S subunit
MSEMKFLDKLLDGVEVELKALGDVAKYSDARIDCNGVNKENYVGVDNLLQNRAGKTDSSYVPTEGRLIEYCPGDVLIGNIRPYLKKIWLANRAGGTNGDVLVVRPTHQSLSSGYLHQVLTDENFFDYNMQHAKGAKMPRGDKAKILEYRLPIPCPDNPKKSLEIQAEIVRILDAFTSLTAELTAELTARKKQYNHYRDQLLRFEDGEVEWKTLGDIGDVKMCKRILKNETKPEGDVPFYKIGTFGKKADAYISRDIFEDYKRKYSFPKKGDVLISASGTIGRAVIYDGEPAYFQDSNIVWLENDESIVTNKYLWHFYKIAKWAISEGGTIDRLYNDNIKKTKIIVPYPSDTKKSLDEQNRVVSILDKFDALTNSFTEGLPREIELRQKQYKYYRDMLLSFPKPDGVEA